VPSKCLRMKPKPERRDSEFRRPVRVSHLLTLLRIWSFDDLPRSVTWNYSTVGCDIPPKYTSQYTLCRVPAYIEALTYPTVKAGMIRT
jgi:hypothetical protein